MNFSRFIIIAQFLILTPFLSTKLPQSVSSRYPVNCDNTPALNKKIIIYVDSQIGKKVGRGECWDLAAEALNSTEAKWDGNYAFGKEVNPKTECVYPGDIIQFSNVTVKWQKDRTIYMEEMEKHTAIIYEVKSSENFMLADQNTGFSGKKVGIHSLEVKNITSGKYKIYRPVK